jgi:hypothetical protein
MNLLPDILQGGPEGTDRQNNPDPAPTMVQRALLTSGTHCQRHRRVMTRGQTVSVCQRKLANTYGVRVSVAHIQTGILNAGFSL